MLNKTLDYAIQILVFANKQLIFYERYPCKLNLCIELPQFYLTTQLRIK